MRLRLLLLWYQFLASDWELWLEKGLMFLMLAFLGFLAFGSLWRLIFGESIMAP
jgi:hypothetical protein